MSALLQVVMMVVLFFKARNSMQSLCAQDCKKIRNDLIRAGPIELTVHNRSKYLVMNCSSVQTI